MPEPLPLVTDFADLDKAIKNLLALLGDAYDKFLKDLTPAQKKVLIFALIRALRIFKKVMAIAPGGCVTEDGQVLTPEECRKIPCPATD